MIVMQETCDMAEYYIPKEACKRCGTRKRYMSTRACLRCVRERDAARTNDRRSHRKRCENMLTSQGHKLAGLSRSEKDYLIGSEFPGMREYLLEEFGVQWWRNLSHSEMV